MVYFNIYQFIPLARTSEIISAVYPPNISDGTVFAASIEMAQQVAPATEQFKAHLMETEDPVYFDETGARVKGKLVWLHSASTEQVTYDEIHPKRGGEAIEAMRILPKRTGWRIQDAWLAYLTYLAAKPGLCNAHLGRELIFLMERHAQDWATCFLDLLLNLKQRVETAQRHGKGARSQFQLTPFEVCYDWIVQTGFEANPSPERPPNQRGRLKHSPARTLLNRLKEHKDKLLAFARDFAVPFDNNRTERDIRMVKVQQKWLVAFAVPTVRILFVRCAATFRRHPRTVSASWMCSIKRSMVRRP